MNTLGILDRLLGFDTVSSRPNRELIDWLANLLDGAGARVRLIEDDSGAKANLYATVGPADASGVVLSGHTDVVPVEGQHWSVPPFAMTLADGRAYGRGAADMKGFVAAATSMALRASTTGLATPLHLGFSYDEEIGCVGVRSLVALLAEAPTRPAMCIVGEPTELAVATGHKGKTGCRVRCTGRAAHSALAPDGLNAVHLAVDLIAELRAVQARLESSGARDDDYGVPYTTVHVGRIEGGGALNIVPDRCTFLFEIRNVASDDPLALLDEIRTAARAIVAAVPDRFDEAAIEIEVFNAYPGLDTSPDADVVAFVRSLVDGTHARAARRGDAPGCKVAFGTEGGLFSSRLGIPTVVCGPGSMAQGHKPDEYVSLDQLARCDAMLERLRERLADG